MEESRHLCINKKICPINCNEWVECLETYDHTYKQSTCCTIICCPIKFPLNLIFFGPCALYNMLRNKCHDTNKNYLC